MQLSVVIAPDSFKGSLPAAEVASALAEGWSSVRPDDTLRLIPQADGGEGTLDAVEAAVAGSVRRDAGLVTGPDGRPVHGQWLELPGGIAVVELAQMCGLPLMKVPDPMGATTFGLGQVIRAALASGARQLVIGLGGSASTDGGAGALAALGLSADDELPAGGLRSITTLDRSELLPPPSGGVMLLTDVSNPLLGADGAAAVYGPQKGANPTQITLLDAGLAHFASFLGGDPTVPGAGAAGGTAYGFAAAWGASIEPGAAYLSRLTGLTDAMADADLLLTGEGRFDATSASGKLVGQLIDLAGEHGVRVAVIAGQLDIPPAAADGAPIWSTSLTALAGSAAAAMADPTRWLHAAAAEVARSVPVN